MRLLTVAFNAPPNRALVVGFAPLLNFLLLVKLRFLLGPSQRQQRKDIGLAQRAPTGTSVSGCSLCPATPPANIVRLHPRRRVDVDGGVDAHRVRKVDIPAL